MFITHELVDAYQETEAMFPGDGAALVEIMVLQRIADSLEDISDALNREGGSDE